MTQGIPTYYILYFMYNHNIIKDYYYYNFSRYPRPTYSLIIRSNFNLNASTLSKQLLQWKAEC